MADRMQFRRDTAANWTAYNPILLEGELGFELDTDQYKLGDGIHNWNALPYRGLPCVQQRGTSVTTPMSQKAVTDELNLIAVFDISAYNLTDGQPTKYADLAAALGTNGANVPESYRRGGMTVKYVQSSDNNYVQYRLMSDTFNTTVANWQGVDTVPTYGSNNFVNSDGIALATETSIEALVLNDIVRGAFCKTGDPIEFTPNYYIPTNVNIGDTLQLSPQSTLSSISYAIVTCQEGDLFFTASNGGNGARLYCFLDSDDKVLAVAPPNITYTNPITVCAPRNSAKVVLNVLNGYGVYNLMQKKKVVYKVLTVENPFVDESHYKVTRLIIFYNNVSVSLTPVNHNEILECAENCYIVYDTETNTVSIKNSYNDIDLFNVVLVYHKNNSWLCDSSDWLSPGFKSKHIFDEYSSDEAIFTQNSVSLSYARGIIGNELIFHEIIENDVRTIKTFTFTQNSYLVYDSLTKTASIKLTYSEIGITEFVWLHYRNNSFVGGLLYESYLAKYVNNNGIDSNDQNYIIKKRAYQYTDVIWEAKNPIANTVSISGISAGTKQGLPYTSCLEVDKFVGFDVSLKTFMTAANNPYSLLYTEWLKVSSTYPNGVSGYGFTYHGKDGGTTSRDTVGGYMGIVCSIFGLNAVGCHIPWATGNWEYLAKIGLFKKKSSQIAEFFEIGDIIIEPGHCNVITGLLYTENNVLKSVEWSESKQDFPVKNTYTVQQANNRLISRSGVIYRLAIPIDYYERSEFVAVGNEVLGTTYQYNNDICTFAGDYAVFREGQIIYLNYNLDPDNIGNWTHIKLYKDGNLIGDSIQINVLEHKLNLTNYNLTYGAYKACMTNGVSDSDFTHFQILQTDVSITYNNDDTITVDFTSENGTPLFIRLCKIDGAPIEIIPLTEDERRKGSITFNPLKFLQGYDLVHNGTYLKVYFASEYGRVTNEPILTTL